MRERGVLYGAGRPMGTLSMNRQLIRPRVRTVHPRDEQARAGLLIDQLQPLDQAGTQIITAAGLPASDLN